MEEQPSGRLVHQRIRNRIMEAVETLADGDDGVRREWPDEYFESFYTWIPHHDDGEIPPITAISIDERFLLLKVSRVLGAASDATPKNMIAAELIATGWPKRIQPVARDALDLMRDRGQISEEQEEDIPSA